MDVENLYGLPLAKSPGAGGAGPRGREGGSGPRRERVSRSWKKEEKYRMLLTKLDGYDIVNEDKTKILFSLRHSPHGGCLSPGWKETSSWGLAADQIKIIEKEC